MCHTLYAADDLAAAHNIVPGCLPCPAPPVSRHSHTHTREFIINTAHREHPTNTPAESSTQQKRPCRACRWQPSAPTRCSPSSSSWRPGLRQGARVDSTGTRPRLPRQLQQQRLRQTPAGGSWLARSARPSRSRPRKRRVTLLLSCGLSPFVPHLSCGPAVCLQQTAAAPVLMLPAACCLPCSVAAALPSTAPAPRPRGAAVQQPGHAGTLCRRPHQAAAPGAAGSG